MYVPLAGSYLDFANPNSLGGSEYQWDATSANEPFQPSQRGPLLLNFGGPYSSISPSLRRPYADEFDIGADIPFLGWWGLGINLFRRDDKDRIAALDTGVPPQDFSPVPYFDDGPLGAPGDPGGEQITGYEQNPATLGQDLIC